MFYSLLSTDPTRLLYDEVCPEQRKRKATSSMLNNLNNLANVFSIFQCFF